ncbi:MAG: NusG domain II-containing protein [Lachnospiraceae bacterium]|nr:NusG domain II-containing protein [Lachnospiraceae bacterium]
MSRKDRQKTKKAEVAFVSLSIFAAVVCGFNYYRTHGVGREAGEHTKGQVEIYVGKGLYGTYSLRQDQSIPVGDSNVVTVEGGTVAMTEADCPDHTCIRQGPVSSPGLPIVCLPNEVVVLIRGEGEEKIDAMVQ